MIVTSEGHPGAGPAPPGDEGLTKVERQSKWRWKQICGGIPSVVANQLKSITDRLIALACLQRGQQIRALQLPEVRIIIYESLQLMPPPHFSSACPLPLPQPRRNHTGTPVRDVPGREQIDTYIYASWCYGERGRDC